MKLQRGQELFQELYHILGSHSRRLVVAGSIRRKKPEVRDIDIVLIPRDPWLLMQEIKELGRVVKSGPKITQVKYRGESVDIYFATEAIWATLLLIRTGSVEHNIRLTTMAKEKGWRLAASGDGLFDQAGRRIAGDTEASIFQGLGIPFLEPEERSEGPFKDR